MPSDTSKDPGKMFIGKRNCSEHKIEVDSINVFQNVDFDPDNPPVAPIDAPDAAGLAEGSTHAEVINGATVFFEVNADGDWEVVLIDEDVDGGALTTILDLTATETFDPSNPPTAPFNAPDECNPGDTLIEKIEGALVFSTKLEDGTWDTCSACTGEFISTRCVDGGVERTRHDGSTFCESQTINARQINTFDSSIQYVEGTPTGPVPLTEGCTTLQMPKCGARIDNYFYHSHKQGDAGNGWISDRPRVSFDGGATYVNVVVGGQDEFHVEGDDSNSEGESGHTDWYISPILFGEITICRDLDINNSRLTSGATVGIPTYSSRHSIIETRCC